MLATSTGWRTPTRRRPLSEHGDEELIRYAVGVQSFLVEVKEGK
jgi:hypothetical protein